MVNDRFRRGAATPRRSRMAYYTRRRQHRLGATSSGDGFRRISPHFMRRVKNRTSLRRRGNLHAMIRPIVVVGAVIALLYGAQYAYQRALTSPALSIQSVRLHQVPTMLYEPVRARVEAAYGQNLLALDLAALRESIESLPAVRSAGVRRVLPDELVVSVIPRQPRARIVAGEDSWVIDADAVVLDAWEARLRLPEVRIDGPPAVTTPGRRLTEDPQYGPRVAAALEVISWMTHADGGVPHTVRHLRLDDAGVVLVAARLEIVVGDGSDMDSKMAAVRSLLRANPPVEPSIIDARYQDMLVVTALPGTAE
jgi:hypothetical protein